MAQPSPRGASQHPQPAARGGGEGGRQLTKDGRTFVGTKIMQREVKEGAKFVADDAHEGLQVCSIHQPVREDSVGRE